MRLSDKQFYIVLGIGALGVYVLYRGAGTAAQAINPVNPDNVFNQAANGLGEAITGDPNATGDLFDHLYGGLDLLNPWAPDYRKDYAKQVWGMK
ncbi:hypothetical protein [Kistimonas asteriae]|uniref:hypothetical protein n=1 Tax=Kistimonas asteriae TaxID=517724 RepID=UPI001BAA5CCE|nr:hypothetical protein [Kistimonas asteriae]